MVCLKTVSLLRPYFAFYFALRTAKNTKATKGYEGQGRIQNKKRGCCMINENKLNTIWTISKYVYGLVPILIGADKFAFFMVNWNIYVSSFAASIVPILYLVPVV